MIKIKLETNITEEDLTDILETALYDGIWYWIEDRNYSKKAHEDKSRAEQIMQDKCLLYVDVDMGDDIETKTISRATLIRGYRRYCEKRITEGRSIPNVCEIDSVEADIIIQLGLFNEIIFG